MHHDVTGIQRVQLMRFLLPRDARIHHTFYRKEHVWTSLDLNNPKALLDDTLDYIDVAQSYNEASSADDRMWSTICFNIVDLFLWVLDLPVPVPQSDMQDWLRSAKFVATSARSLL